MRCFVCACLFSSIFYVIDSLARAAQIFYELLEEYKSRNVGLFITHLRYRVEKTFKKAGIFDLLGADAFRDNVAEAMQIVESTRVAEPEPSFASSTH